MKFYCLGKKNEEEARSKGYNGLNLQMDLDGS